MIEAHVAPQTVAGLADFAGRRHGDRRAVRVKRDDVWEERSYAEVATEIERLACGFIDRGIALGDRVCILADTRPEWSVASGRRLPLCSWSRLSSTLSGSRG